MQELINPYKMFQGAFIPNAILENKALSQSAKLCWARLAQFAGSDGKCHPKMQQIADGIGVSRAQAKRVIKELADNGFIKVVPPTGQAKLKHWPNEYFFLNHTSFTGGHNHTSGGVINDTSERVVNDTSQDGAKTSHPSKRIIQENQCNKEKGAQVGSDFDIFWNKYPKKKSKGTARKAWGKINPGKKKFSTILAGLSQAVQSPDWQKENGKFIPHPATWLNAEGWDDEEDITTNEPIDYRRQAEVVEAEKTRIRQLKEKKANQAGASC